MDGLTAKRVLIALSRKLGFNNVRRCNRDRKYTLKLVKGTSSCHIIVRPIGTSYQQDQIMSSNSAKWENIINALAGKEIRLISYSGSSPDVVVHSPEQLAVDLELEGFLKNIQGLSHNLVTTKMLNDMLHNDVSAH